LKIILSILKGYYITLISHLFNLYKQYFKSTDFGLAYGIGVKLPVSETAKINIEYDGQSGLSDIIKNNSGTSIRNARGAFNVGIIFTVN